MLVTSLKSKTLFRLDFENGVVKDQYIVFEDLIGRIRDIEINNNGEIFLIDSGSSGSLWKLKNK